MAIFRDTVPMNDTGTHDSLDDLNKTIQDSLFESMAEFTERISIKDTAASEIFREDDRIKNIESDFAKDFGFNEVEFLKANTERFLKEYVPLDDVDSPQDIEALREDEFANLYTRFSDALVYSEWGEGPNCYAFAMDMTVNPITGKVFSSRPTIGEISGNQLPGHEMMDLLMYADEEHVKSVLVDLWSKDCEAIGKELVEVSSGDYVPKEGETLTALMYGNDTVTDFHFMRKGDYGRWYHKPGISNPTTYDNSGRFIQDPKDCDRGIYNHFCGYFVIRDKEVAV